MRCIPDVNKKTHLKIPDAAVSELNFGRSNSKQRTWAEILHATIEGKPCCIVFEKLLKIL